MDGNIAWPTCPNQTKEGGLSCFPSLPASDVEYTRPSPNNTKMKYRFRVLNSQQQ